MRSPHPFRTVLSGLAGLALLLAAPRAGSGRPEVPSGEARNETPRFPNVLIVTIDTLRADRLSAYGYRRPTTPNLDRLLAPGVRFTQARTVEPLTNPALCSMFTSLYPHEHGATRNGLRLRPDCRRLARDARPARLPHRRLRGQLDPAQRASPASASTSSATTRCSAASAGSACSRARPRPRTSPRPRSPGSAEHREDGRAGRSSSGSTTSSRTPPTASRRLSPAGWASRRDGRGLARATATTPRSPSPTTRSAGCSPAVERDPALAANTLIVFAADHGESLGEHGYWGHGRNLYEPNLRIPLGSSGPASSGRRSSRPRPSTSTWRPTVLGLLGLPVPTAFRGFDWTPVLAPRRAAAARPGHAGSRPTRARCSPPRRPRAPAAGACWRWRCSPAAARRSSG